MSLLHTQKYVDFVKGADFGTCRGFRGVYDSEIALQEIQGNPLAILLPDASVAGD